MPKKNNEFNFNTINVVQKAISLRDERKENPQLPNYDEVWAIFDKDDFPAKRYHAAIELAKKNDIESGHSNQSFELWYLLQFQFLDSALERSDYVNILTKNLGYKYVKNSEDVVRAISVKGNLTRAIKMGSRIRSAS